MQDMKEAIEKISQELQQLKATTQKEAEEARIRFLGKKGEITALMEQFRTIAPELKREYGQKLNELKKTAQEKIEALKSAACETKTEATAQDLTMPGDSFPLGSRHPVSIVRQQIVDIFRKFGYDAFFVSTGHLNPLLLRTHTSSVQVRTMESQPLPIRVVCPGRVFRNEAISARAHCIFHQVEGLYIDKNVTFADLKQAILLFAREMFGPETEIRMRPSYFPFTEPSAEVDVSCNICHGKGCNICKGTGWLEIMGCGMVDPNVLKASGIDPEVYSGFAFGMGVERIAMLKWQVNDLRHYFENDMRFLSEFATATEV